MNARRRPGGDRGSSTAELAVGLPALVLLLLAGLTAVAAVTPRGQVLHAAREGALAAARDADGGAAAARVAPAGASVTVSHGGDSVTVQVAASVPLLGARLPRLRVTGTAVAAREPRGDAP